MNNDIIEKYISEETIWDKKYKHGPSEIYEEIVDYIEDSLAHFEMYKDSAEDLDSKGRMAKADLERTFENLDNSWESFKKMLGFMVKKIEKYN